jgi:hypothetical protein
VPDDCSLELEHAAFKVTLKRCVGRCISFVCDIGQNYGMYQNTKIKDFNLR